MSRRVKDLEGEVGWGWNWCMGATKPIPGDAIESLDDASGLPTPATSIRKDQPKVKAYSALEGHCNKVSNVLGCVRLAPPYGLIAAHAQRCTSGRRRGR
jgi:hypothetical protein